MLLVCDPTGCCGEDQVASGSRSMRADETQLHMLRINPRPRHPRPAGRTSDQPRPCAQPSFGFFARIFISRYRFAPPSRLFCGLRSTAIASSGTSLVITEPEPI